MAIEGRSGNSLFSEYELLSDYVSSRHESRFRLRFLPWVREGAILFGIELYMIRKIAWFVSFEDSHKLGKRNLLIHLWFWKNFFLKNYLRGRARRAES